jgi:multicomponent Na+:H+ antiporter subunit G
MSATTQLIGGGIAAVGCAVAVLDTLAMLLVRSVPDRLHFLSPGTSIAGPLVGAGLIVHDGLSLTSGQIALVVIVLAATGPAITAAFARTWAEREHPATEEAEPE